MSRRPWLEQAVVFMVQLALIGAFLALWEFAADRFIDPTMVSRPSKIWAQASRWLARGILEKAAGETLWIVLLGMLGGAASGVLAGLACAAWRPLDRLIEPLVTMLFALPKVALIPLFILWFGVGDTEKTALTVTVVFFFFFYSARNGMRSLPKPLDNMMLLIGASWGQRLRLLYMPASVGWLLSGLRVALPYAFVTVVSAEVVSARGGLGFLAKNNAAAMNAAGVFAAIASLTLLGAATSGFAAWLVGRSRWTIVNR
jgi:NitT/TauT family transport system permease protein